MAQSFREAVADSPLVSRSSIKNVDCPSTCSGHKKTYIKCFFIKALPEPDFKYFSKLYAFIFIIKCKATI